MVSHRGRDLRSITASGDNGVAGGQGSLGDVDAQASPSAGDEPNIFSGHGMFLNWIKRDYAAHVGHFWPCWWA